MNINLNKMALQIPMGKTFGNIKDSVGNVLHEIRSTKGYEDTLKCEVIVINDKLHGTSYRGITNEAGNLLFIPSLMRVFTNCVPFYWNGKKCFLVSSLYHSTLNLLTLKKISESMTYTVFASFKWLKNWEKIRMDKVQSTFDFTLWDNKYSLDFSSDSYRILQSKSLEFLSEYPNRVYIMTAIISALIGIIFGFIMAVMGIGMLMYFT